MNHDNVNETVEAPDILPSDTSRMATTVLLVDDDAKLLRGLQRSFADEEFEILTAVSAAEANVILKNYAVHIIVSDNLMAGEMGTRFLARVSKEYPHITLMMLSGYMPATAADKLINDGVFRVLAKPCESSEVAAAIREAAKARNS